MPPPTDHPAAPAGPGSPLLARLQLLAAAALFSTGGAAIKYTALEGAQVAGLRSTAGALVLLALVPGTRRGWSGRVWLVGVAYGATLLLYAVGNKLTTAANAIFLQSTAPIYILLLAPWLLGERMRRREIPFVAAIAAGMALFFVEQEPATSVATHPVIGNLLGAGAGVSWAFTVMGLRGLERGAGRAGSGSAGTAAVAGNLLVVAATLPWLFQLSDVGLADWGTVAYLGFVQVGLAYVLLTRAIHAVPAIEAVLLLMLEPVLTPLWAWALLGERPGTWALTGGGLILAASVAQTVVAARRPATGP